MSNQESDLLWLRDLLEEIASCRRRQEWFIEDEALDDAAETMLADLNFFPRLFLEAYRRGDAPSLN